MIQHGTKIGIYKALRVIAYFLEIIAECDKQKETQETEGTEITIKDTETEE